MKIYSIVEEMLERQIRKAEQAVPEQKRSGHPTRALQAPGS